MLESNYVCLDEDTQDKPIWTRNAADGDYTAKKGYEIAITEQFDGEKSWWWQGLWKTECPLKTILTFWLAINNRLLTWENLRKRGIQGPGFCILCKQDDELTSRLFGTCSYAGKVWTDVTRSLSQGRMRILEGTWEQRTKGWWNNKAICEFSDFPVLFVFTIWEAQNRAMFKNSWNPIDMSSAVLMQKV